MRRSQRMAALTRLLLDQPRRVVTLAELGRELDAAKSTLSEDLAIIRHTFAELGLGRIETLAGAAGGVRYLPELSPAQVRQVADELCQCLRDPARVLPGGFLYMSDLVASPPLLARIGEAFATRFAPRDPEAVVTVETRGIPIALMTARALNVPLVIVRRVSRLSEGSVVTMNYLSGSARRIETMSLSRRALAPGTAVVIVDDFMKAGGTAKGLIDLMGELGARVVGLGVLVATAEPREKLVRDYCSLSVLERVDEVSRTVQVRPAPWVREGAAGEDLPGGRGKQRPGQGARGQGARPGRTGPPGRPPAPAGPPLSP